jgi:hypothetical protein
MKLKNNFPWLVFALVLSISVSLIEKQGIDLHARQVASNIEEQNLSKQNQTRVIDTSRLSHLSQIQRVLETTRGPSSIDLK